MKRTAGGQTAERTFIVFSHAAERGSANTLGPTTESAYTKRFEVHSSSSSSEEAARGARRSGAAGSSSTQGGSARSASDTRSRRPARGTVPPPPPRPPPRPRAAPQRSLNSSVCEHQCGALAQRGGGGGGGGAAPPARHQAASSTTATPAYERPTAMVAPSVLHESVAGSNTCATRRSLAPSRESGADARPGERLRLCTSYFFEIFTGRVNDYAKATLSQFFKLSVV